MNALDDDEQMRDSSVVWNSDGTKFEITNTKKFEKKVLALILDDSLNSAKRKKQGTYRNFSMYLNRWGFRIGQSTTIRNLRRWYHPLFARHAFTSKKSIAEGGNGHDRHSDSDSDNKNTAEYSEAMSESRKRELVEKIIEMCDENKKKKKMQSGKVLKPRKVSSRDILIKFYREVCRDKLFIINLALIVSPDHLPWYIEKSRH